MSTRILLALITLTLLGAPAQAEDKGIELETPYLLNPVAGAHRITLHVRADNTASVTLDPNTCATNPFGDATACTRIAHRTAEVRLLQAKLADPSGAGRKLYLLAGMPGTEGKRWPKYYLVAPKQRAGTYRFIEETAAARRNIVTLEHGASEAAAPRPGTLPACKNVTYRAEHKEGKVTIYASGNHPTPGYKAFFEALPIRIWPPQFRLVCQKEIHGLVPQVLVPYEVTTSFRADKPVKSVTVHDADGKHGIEVKFVR